MATATPTRPQLNRAESQRKVRHPLQALRGQIRAYILAEGAAIGLIFVGIAFWLGFFLDWGLFNLYHVWQAADVDLLRGLWCDWVRWIDGNLDKSVSFWLRAIFLGIVALGLIGVVAYSVMTRLFREFSDATLALVLERRFPRELGDRLITAVELADPALSKKYGYSQAMVDKTISDAAERVARLPVKGVFNRKRLLLEWVGAIGLSVGLYGLALGSVAGSAAMAADTGEFGHQFGRNSVALHGNAFTWIKRNIFLMEHEYWLPEAYIEIARFQGKWNEELRMEEMRVGRDEERPDIQARAYQWVIVDRSARDGIRPLKFSDLSGLVGENLLAIDIPETWGGWIVDLDDLAAGTPSGVIPQEWQGQRVSEVQALLRSDEIQGKINRAEALDSLLSVLDWKTWTVDKIFLQALERREVREALRSQNPEIVDRFFDLKKALEELTEQGPTGMVHKLKIPEEVKVLYRGQTIKSEAPARWSEGNKFYIGLSDLKESVTFTVQGENYATPPRQITLVPPPGLESLVMNKSEPAYRYYLLQGALKSKEEALKIKDDRQLALDFKVQEKLKGQKQIFEGVSISIAGEFSSVAVPSGVDVELVAVAGRDLKDNIRIEPALRPKVKGSSAPDLNTRVSLWKEKVKNENGEEVEVIRPNTFKVSFKRVTRPIEFEFLFVDVDNVKGKRHVIIEPVEDKAPQEAGNIEIAAVLRKPAIKGDSKGSEGGALDGYLITPDALLPLRGGFRDDNGLTRMNWVYEAEQIEFELMRSGSSASPDKKKDKTPRFILGGNAQMRRATMALSLLQFTPNHANLPWAAGPAGAMVDRLIDYDLKESAKRGPTLEGSIPLQRFLNRFYDQRDEVKDTPWVALPPLLQKKAPRSPFLTEHSLVQEDGFDIRKHVPKLKARDASQDVQLHYRLKLSVSATDNNVETGPATTFNKLPMTFLIVSESELRIQILVEEENIRDRLEKMVQKLKQQKINIDEQVSKLANPEPPLGLVGLRADEARKLVQDGYSVGREALADYIRILTEMEINRLDDKTLKTVSTKIVGPLEEITNPTNGNFSATETAITRLWEGVEADAAELKRFEDEKKAVDPATAQKLAGNRLSHLQNSKDAQAQLGLLIRRLDAVVDEIGGVLIDAQVVAILVEVEQFHRQAVETLSRYHKDFLEDLLKRTLEGSK